MRRKVERRRSKRFQWAIGVFFVFGSIFNYRAATIGRCLPTRDSRFLLSRTVCEEGKTSRALDDLPRNLLQIILLPLLYIGADRACDRVVNYNVKNLFSAQHIQT